MSNEDRKAEQERLARERVELIKLKQGIIEESEIIEETPVAYTKLIGWDKAKNFMYHNKPYVIGGVFIALVLAFLAYDMLSREHEDLRLLTVTDEFSITQNLPTIEAAFEAVAEDFNGNGKVHIAIFPVFFNEAQDNQNYIMNQTKLSGELQVAEAMLILCDDANAEKILADQTLLDLTTLFPDNDHIKGYGYYISGTSFAKSMGWEDCPEDIFVAVRDYKVTNTPNSPDTKERHDNAMKVLENIIAMG